VSTTILAPTNLTVKGPQVFSVPVTYSHALPITCTQINNLANIPIDSAATVCLLLSTDGENWIPTVTKTFTLDDQTDIQQFSAWEIQYKASKVYDGPLFWYRGNPPVYFVPYLDQEQTFQSPWAYMMLVFTPPLGDIPGLAVTVTAVIG
jgi:hypothetical protein